jgi:PilZ domain
MAIAPLPFPKSHTKIDDERRLEPRYGAEGEVTLVVFDPRTKNDMELSATLLDFSLHGLRLRMMRELKKGQEVRVIFSWGEASTQVMWTARLANGFESGLQLF